jgi:hypothetical protein
LRCGFYSQNFRNLWDELRSFAEWSSAHSIADVQRRKTKLVVDARPMQAVPRRRVVDVEHLQLARLHGRAELIAVARHEAAVTTPDARASNALPPAPPAIRHRRRRPRRLSAEISRDSQAMSSSRSDAARATCGAQTFRLAQQTASSFHAGKIVTAPTAVSGCFVWIMSLPRHFWESRAGQSATAVARRLALRPSPAAYAGCAAVCEFYPGRLKGASQRSHRRTVCSQCPWSGFETLYGWK